MFIQEAESLFERVLAIREKTQGMAHPDYLDTLYDLLRGYESFGYRAQAQRGMELLTAGHRMYPRVRNREPRRSVR